ncbi:MAG TPA: lysophospholipid acyltransferase family protein [Armatimonadota bacterium]|jgi:1-acyl-sn-glycerol-3-phosphate acyltransferase
MPANWFHNFAKTVLGNVTRALVGPVDIYGLENVPPSGPIILASNHQSYLDPIVISWKFPRPMRAMAKKQLFKIPIFGYLISVIGAYPVDQEGSPRAGIRSALAVLDEGYPFLIFVEGHRTRGPLGQVQPGAALIARKSGVPVVPVLVTGAHCSLSPDHPGMHRGHITVTYGQPMYFDKDEKRPDLAADAARILDAIAALRDVTPNAAPEIRAEDLPPERQSSAAR